MASSDTSSDKTPAFLGKNTGEGTGLFGRSKNGRGVEGWSETNYGVTGDSQKFPGVRGTSVDGRGVEGWSTANDGVWGISKDAKGVHGVSENKGTGVFGESKDGRGVEGWSETNYGVTGDSQKFPGVRGTSVDGRGVEGWSTKDDGVFGISKDATGVHGFSEDKGTGVFGESKNGFGVHGKGGRLAGFFEGDVEVTGDVRLINADCAEQFDVAEMSEAEPGTVMVLGEDGSLRPSTNPYDKRVVGVVSGAGTYKPGIVLDQRVTGKERRPIALLGKVYCKVDARHGAIEAGDLLTTSGTLGHAMKANDQTKAFGTVIGKALWPLHEGQGLIPVLVALQ